MAGFPPELEDVLAKLPLDALQLGQRTHTVRTSMGRLAGVLDRDAATQTIEIKGNSTRDVLNSGLALLLERQDTFGALLHYPRTLVIGPDAGFRCNASGQASLTHTEAVAHPEGNPHRRNVDQVIWVTLCDEPGVKEKVTVSWLQYLHSAYATTPRPDLISSNMNVLAFPSDPSDTSPAKGGALEQRNVVFRDTGLGTEANAYKLLAVDEANVATVDSTAPDMHVKRALAVVELIMRIRDASFDGVHIRVRNVNRANSVYRAVLAGFVPIAAEDLDETMMQPTVTPGVISPEELLDVVEIIRAQTQSQGTSTRARLAFPMQPELSMALPSDASIAGMLQHYIGDSQQDDAVHDGMSSVETMSSVSSVGDTDSSDEM